MEAHSDDDMVYVCSEDGLALTGRELRERAERGEGVTPIHSAGRVLHAWDICDDGGNELYREYTTTSGYLISDEEVMTNSQAFAEAYVDPRILDPDSIIEAANDASDEMSFSGLRKRHSGGDVDFLTDNADQLAEIAHSFQVTLSQLFLGAWEGAHPYLVGQDHVYRLPIKGPQAVADLRDDFIDQAMNYEEINRRSATVLWEAVDPVLFVPIDLYIDGEQVA